MPLPARNRQSQKTRRGRVVHTILQSIFTCSLKGGDRLVEEDLALTIGVSRTPVREALSELVGIGLVTVKPNHGAVVRPFGAAQIRELYHVRRILESEAARLAAGRIHRGALLEIQSKTQAFLHEQPRAKDWAAATVRLDRRFHELVRAHCGSDRLAEEIGRSRGLVDAMREAVGNSHRAQDVALVEHLRIIDRLLAGDGDGAAAAMHDHIVRGTEAAVTALCGGIHVQIEGVPAAGEDRPPHTGGTGTMASLVPAVEVSIAPGVATHPRAGVVRG